MTTQPHASRRTFAVGVAAAIPLLAMTTSRASATTAPTAGGNGRTTYILSPHPDDEMARLARYIIMAADRGDRIVLIQDTDGGATGVQYRLGLSSAETTRLRYMEQENAFNMLTHGKGEIVRLGQPDGGANWEVTLAGVRDLMGSPAKGKELYVATWHHDSEESHSSDLHRDHVAAVKAARQIAADGHVVRYGRHPGSKYTRGTSYDVRTVEQERRLIGAIEAYRPIGWESARGTFNLMQTRRNRITS